VSTELLQALTTVLFGALAGGATNAVAVWMLFHPHHPPSLGRWRLSFLQGAVPKNQPRLAAAIGRTVGGKLLTEEDLTRLFSQGEFRAAFDDRLQDFLEKAFQTRRGSLRELLPPETLPQVEVLLGDTLERVAERIERFLAEEEFAALLERRAGELVALVADEPIGAVLTPAREAALSGAVDEWLASMVEGDEFRETVDGYLSRTAERLLAPGRTFEEVLPAGLVGALERAIAGYLPLAIQRLGGMLEDPGARERFEATLQELLRRFLADLRFHQRVVARLIVTEETVEKVLDTIRDEGAARVSEMLREPEMQAAMARGVNDAVVDFLRRPVTSVLGEPGDESVREARETIAGWVVQAARDPAGRAFVVEKLQSALDRAGARTWGELFQRVPPERVAGWVVQAARSELSGSLLRQGARRLAPALLDRRLGRPADWMGDGAAARVEGALADPIWGWMQTQVPEVVRRMDVARRVEQKVLEFPVDRMEELVRRVTERELRIIVRLGYVLGAFVGAVLVGVTRLMG